MTNMTMCKEVNVVCNVDFYRTAVIFNSRGGLIHAQDNVKYYL
jgi:hypothetical protein